MSASDRELLELAAKAAGINRRYYRCSFTNEVGMINDDPDGGMWNPLTDDGAALRLAVLLKIVITVGRNNVEARLWTGGDFEAPMHCQNIPLYNDPYAATRRAIVLCAAEIDKAATT